MTLAFQVIKIGGRAQVLSPCHSSQEQGLIGQGAEFVKAFKFTNTHGGGFSGGKGPFASSATTALLEAISLRDKLNGISHATGDGPKKPWWKFWKK